MNEASFIYTCEARFIYPGPGFINEARFIPVRLDLYIQGLDL